MKYDRAQIISRYKNGEELEYIFFTGHKKMEPIGKTCFSQWYLCEFIVDGVKYYTAEQYMMAQKALLFEDPNTFNKIMEEKSPKMYKQLGREVANFDSIRWNQYKYDIVLKGNIAKFSQNEEMKKFLLSTGDSIIVEASPWDKIWGIGKKEDFIGIRDPQRWAGTNLLGFAIMEARDIIREKEE